MNVYVREYKKIEHRTRRRDNFLLRYLPTLLLLAAVVVIGKIYVQSVAIRWSGRVMDLRESARDLELQNEDLVRSIATLTTRERITRDAGRRLGMVVPSGEEVVWLPVLDREGGRSRGANHAGRDSGSLRAVRTWLHALWQEEALALTSH
jgi:cell division protein FtsL